MVRLTGLLDAMAYGCFPAFLSGKITALLDIWGEVPVAKLQFKISSGSLFSSWGQRVKIGGMSSGSGAPFDLIFRITRCHQDV